jgi:phosphoglycolate phosphatase
MREGSDKFATQICDRSTNSSCTLPGAIFRSNRVLMAANSSSRPLLVFDLDGTLADTAGDLILTLNFILAREGLSGLSLAQGRPMVGGGAKVLIERGLAANGIIASEARLEEMFNDFLARYEAHICDETVLYPGVIDALDRFEAAGWDFAVCTNKIEHPSLKLLTALGVAHRFKAICGKDTFATSKPDGEALLQTIMRAGGDRQKSIMVGDTKTDIDTARNAKVPVVAVNFGYADRPVEQFKPDRVIKHFDDLWDAVEALANIPTAIKNEH